MDIITTWLTSLIENAPYLFGAIVAIYALWRELNQCIDRQEKLSETLLDHILDMRSKQ